MPDPGRTSVPCRNNAHVRCHLPGCGCECHDKGRPSGTATGAKKYRPEVGLEWEEPPSQFRKTSPTELLRPLIVELRRNPGRWARLCVYKSNSSAATSSSKLRKAYPDIEFAARRLDDGGSALYGRFIEGDDE